MVVAALHRQRTVLSLTTRFCLPHEGMMQLEYLSRGSAVLLDSAATPSAATSIVSPPRLQDLKILTCQHVACPWLFPNYFADKWDWLQHVSEEFVQHSLQLLEFPAEDMDTQTGFRPRVLVDVPLGQQVWLHPDRDLAMLAIDEHDEQRWNEIAAQWQLHALALNPTPTKAGDLLLFSGHKQLDDDNDTESATSTASGQSSKKENTNDSVGQCPKEVYGRFVGHSTRGQAFAWSEEILEEGMCGGAVVDKAGDCVGLVEGIVPPHDAATGAQTAAVVASDATQEEREAAAAVAATVRMQKALENHVAFVSSTEIHEFLHDGQSHVVLTGMGLDL